ncbi:hypothetical protein KS4_22250 [Poriferisphaera corsica]|uniref:Ice-binding protein C-terminal domain-containing protein n=1 Tax=Poriferisphaera corsica TaxID=2528020 RepID=A0A517YV93_9BACT|nr:PEP-CTERM sorting domain-containing protein [Poriferisphaera corsica]QDU34163.1 hypothetical protein KS4_22250 [Poriferisphaera corsica]
MRKRSILLCAMLAVVGLVGPAQADIIAGFTVDTSATGWKPGDFPLDAEYGSGSFTVSHFDQTLQSNGDYYAIDHFSGTTLNRLEGTGSSRGMYIRGTSNGAQAIWSVSTDGYEDIQVSWAQKGTSTGFDSRVIEYSADGGNQWTHVETQSGTLSGTWAAYSLDLSSITQVDNNADFQFRITYDGATADTGRNRWDNFFVQGAVAAIPEPASLMLMGLGSLALVRRKKK